MSSIPDPVSDRFLSRDACRALADRIFKRSADHADAEEFLTIDSRWSGNLRWARDRVTTGGDVQETRLSLTQNRFGALGSASTNALDDASIAAMVVWTDQLLQFRAEDPEHYPEIPSDVHPHSQPAIWFDATYNVDADARGKVAASVIATVEQTDCLSAGYLQVDARGTSVLNTSNVFRYYPHTAAQYSITVRHKNGTGSGWAGVDFSDWRRIDPAKLSAIAIDKCLRSANPVAIEPGRYTAILEPQALCDLFAPVIERGMDRHMAESGMGPFAAGGGNSKIGEKVLDERITVSADPMDPDLGFVPFDWSGEPYLHVDWIAQGVLRELAYSRSYGLQELGKDWALPNSTAFRISGGPTTADEMVASTKRGVYVTRFNNVQIIDLNSMLLTGNTRDGLWLIENGKIAKSIKNFRFTESPLFVLNNLEQLGVAQRVFRPTAPAVCPYVKVRDFSFTGLMDAV